MNANLHEWNSCQKGKRYNFWYISRHWIPRCPDACFAVGPQCRSSWASISKQAQTHTAKERVGFEWFKAPESENNNQTRFHKKDRVKHQRNTQTALIYRPAERTKKRERERPPLREHGVYIVLCVWARALAGEGGRRPICILLSP